MDSLKDVCPGKPVRGKVVTQVLGPVINWVSGRVSWQVWSPVQCKVSVWIYNQVGSQVWWPVYRYVEEHKKEWIV
jgi:hypothetical protein